MFLNRVILIGRIVVDPDIKYTPSGIPVTQFRLAVDRPMSAEARQNGQEKQTDFINIVAWRQSAEYAANYLGKGRLVAVEGRLQIREYQTQDGQKRRDAEVVVDNLKSLDRPKEGEGNGGGGGYAANGGGGRDREDMGAMGGGRFQDEREVEPAPAPSRRPAPASGGGAGRYQPPAEDVDDPFADD